MACEAINAKNAKTPLHNPPASASENIAKKTAVPTNIEMIILNMR
jgi:hypothetical protein